MRETGLRSSSYAMMHVCVHVQTPHGARRVCITRTGFHTRRLLNESTIYWMQRPVTCRSFCGLAARFPCHKYPGNLSSSSMNWGEGHRHVMASESLGRSLIDSSPRVSLRKISLLRQNSCLCGHDLLVYVSMKFFISAPPHFSSLR